MTTFMMGKMALYKTKPSRRRHIINFEAFKIKRFSSAVFFLSGLVLGGLLSQNIPFVVPSLSPQPWSAASISTARARVCFSPEGRCTEGIVQAIQEATSSIYVQAYGFTSPPVAQALVNAKKRGVDVQVLLDKSQITAKNSQLPFLFQNNIAVSIDSPSGIAHNKVMILDGKHTLTGSFNFTNAADSRNAENVLIIQDKELAHLYKTNWDKRARFSKPYREGS